MIKSYKLVTVFKNLPNQEVPVERLIWDEGKDDQIIVVSLDDKEDMYYEQDFLSVMNSSYSEGITKIEIIL